MPTFYYSFGGIVQSDLKSHEVMIEAAVNEFNLLFFVPKIRMIILACLYSYVHSTSCRELLSFVCTEVQILVTVLI